MNPFSRQKRPCAIFIDIFHLAPQLIFHFWCARPAYLVKYCDRFFDKTVQVNFLAPVRGDQLAKDAIQVANLIRDRQLLEAAKREAAAVLAGPNPEISQEEINRALRHMRTRWQRTYGLVEVG